MLRNDGFLEKFGFCRKLNAIARAIRVGLRRYSRRIAGEE
jgi:hypothetical protein